MSLVFLIMLFSLYVHSEKQIDLANTQRHHSFLLAEELRQSSNVLTRMARTYVHTGEPIYKKLYQEIIGIRNGIVARPKNYSMSYWDLILPNQHHNRPNKNEGEKISLLVLMKQTDFTENELVKLTEAKLKSDALTLTELAAMALVKPIAFNVKNKQTASPLIKNNHLNTKSILYDNAYYQAKADIMQPINEFYKMMDARTITAVKKAKNIALIFRILFISVGIFYVWSLWRSYQLIKKTLGTSPSALYELINQIGHGNFTSTIPTNQTSNTDNSVLNWLVDTQKQLAKNALEHTKAEQLKTSRSLVLELIANGEALAKILTAIVLSVEENNPQTLCSILILDNNGKHLLMGAAPNLPTFYNEAIDGIEIGEGVGSCGSAAFLEKRVIVEDIKNHPYWAPYKELAAQAQLGSCWSQPIISSQNKVLGTFAIYHHSEHSPTNDDIKLIEQTASLASIAIEKNNSDEKQQLSASVFTHASEGIVITNVSGNIIEVNDAFCEITGYSRGELIDQNPRLLKSGHQPDAFYIDMWNELIQHLQWTGEMWNRRKNGEVYAEMKSITAVQDSTGNTTHYVALCNDITAMKKHQQQLEHIAHYDVLTNLPNRVLLTDRLSQAMRQCRRHQKSLALVFLDLDFFKAVNDTHGHDVGDSLLIVIAERMKKSLRNDDTLARFGGDEFVAILTDLNKFEDCLPELQRLLKAASEKVVIKNIELSVSASLGIAIFPQDNVGADLLLRHADQAMYIAKNEGKNCYHLFDSEQNNALKRQNKDLAEFRKSIHNDEFVMYYQPKVNMKTGKVIGAEALIRWQHPKKGLLAPAEFLPLIKNHSLSIILGEWVLATVMKQINKWQEMDVYLQISVNIDALQIQQDDFVEKIKALLLNHPTIKPRYLELEVLETSALENVLHISEVMNACLKLGVNFALDDFGTGYSSLTYLRRLPASLIKIDQSFVRDMLVDADDLAIVDGVIGLAKSFKREVIAEGVETIEHGCALLKIGCKLAQGYGIAKPMPAKELPNWVKNWQPDKSWKI